MNSAEIPLHNHVPKLIDISEPPEYHRGAMYLEINEIRAGEWGVKVLHKPSGKYLFGWTVATSVDRVITDELWRMVFRYMGAE